jgi:hypothetical protein
MSPKLCSSAYVEDMLLSNSSDWFAPFAVKVSKQLHDNKA